MVSEENDRPTRDRTTILAKCPSLFKLGSFGGLLVISAHILDKINNLVSFK